MNASYRLGEKVGAWNMKTCKDCAFWENYNDYHGQIEEPIDPDTYRPMDIGFDVKACKSEDAAEAYFEHVAHVLGGERMRKDKKLEQAIRECEAFLEECKAYQKRINQSYTTYYGCKTEKYFDNASTKPAIDYSTCCVPSILDACCGSRMFWFDKDNPNVLFIDKRRETVMAKDRHFERIIDIDPDLVADFTDMPFDNNSFHLVVFDPPHLKTLGKNSWLAKKYGNLPENWEEVISKGFDECMRVLKPNGTLIFKWNEHEIKVRQVLDLIPYKPLFGHTTGRSGKTIWMAFMKFS